MALRRVLIASAILFLGSPGGALAQGAPKAAPQKECPHAFSDREAIVKTMGEAATCAVALEIFQACAGGASGDTEYGEAAVGRCEKDFAGRLSAAQERAYKAARGRCDRKYAKKQGTMYISFTAFCHAEVASSYARRHGPRAPQKQR